MLARLTKWITFASRAFCTVLLLALSLTCIRSYFVSDDLLRSWHVAWTEVHPTNPSKIAIHEATGTFFLSSALGNTAISWSTSQTLADPAESPYVDNTPFRLDWFHSRTALRPVYNDALHFTTFLGIRYYAENFPLSPRWRMSSDRDKLQIGMSYTTFVLPYWLLLTLAALPLLPPVYRSLGARLRRPRSPSACPTCRYDLRAHSAGQVCPECGTLIVSAPATATDAPVKANPPIHT